MRDTIFALATAPGRAAVAVVRVSGPLCEPMLRQICGGVPNPRTTALKTITDQNGDAIDRGLVLWFPAPGSFTGEDVFELQLHGGAAVLEAVAERLAGLGARPADPGEFTRRAFEGGRMDLSQAEAVADLVDAETEAQRRQAFAQLDGALAKQGEAWREDLLTALAFLEAQIDFPDEDVPENVADRARAPLVALMNQLDAALANATGERIRNGLRIALIGPPNAGKSSLFNALLGRDAAIVTSKPGTTRDVIEAPYGVAGHTVILADTAGMRATEDEIEAEGVRRARAWAESADLRIWLADPQYGPGDLELYGFMRGGDWLAFTKSDLQLSSDHRLLTLATAKGVTTLETSIVDSGGLDDLRGLVASWAATSLSGADLPLITRMRHRRLLTEASAHLHRALARSNDASELVAEDVRLTYRAIERLSGRMNPEDVLDRIFSTFCIGK